MTLHSWLNLWLLFALHCKTCLQHEGLTNALDRFPLSILIKGVECECMLIRTIEMSCQRTKGTVRGGKSHAAYCISCFSVTHYAYTWTYHACTQLGLQGALLSTVPSPQLVLSAPAPGWGLAIQWQTPVEPGYQEAGSRPAPRMCCLSCA